MLSALKTLLSPRPINISGASITDVNGDSYTHHGDVYNARKIFIHSSQAGNHLRHIILGYPGSSPYIGFPWLTIADRVSMGATYDSQERDPPPRCLPGTRSEVLEKINAWVQAGAEGTKILWLHSPAGSGKSAIAQTVAETCAERNQLAASFFFARLFDGRNDMKYLFPTIAVQIALSVPEKRQSLDGILSSDPYIAERAWGSADLVASLYQDDSQTSPSPFLVVIDGLDECHGHDDQCRLLTQLSHILNTHHLPLRSLIASRPESHLCEAFEEPALAKITDVVPVYGDIRAHEDVSIYLRNEFSRILGSKRHRSVMQFVHKPWPPNDIIERIVRRSGGHFIYASMVIKFVDEEYFSPVARLKQVLNNANPSIPESMPFVELDKLYTQILSSSPISHLPVLKRILGYIVLTRVGIPRIMHVSIADIGAVLRLPLGQVQLTLRGLRSLISFGGPSDPAILIHKSFGDFLLDNARSKYYHIDPEEWYHTAFQGAFSIGCNVVRVSVNPGTSYHAMLPSAEGLYTMRPPSRNTVRN